MDKNFKTQIVNSSNSIEQLAKKICGYGYFDHSGEDYPVKIEHIIEYLEIGMMFGAKRVGEILK
jgi:hypothetical protein